MDSDKIFNEITQQVCKEFANLFNEVIQKTPIRTGAARTSHKLKNTPFNPNDTNYKLYNHDDLKPYLVNDKLALISNCPYIGKLESGFSSQAPFGFYSVSLLDFNTKHKGK